jgi:hypothetical protein
VPAAIHRALRLPEHDGRVFRLLREHLPRHASESALRDFDAKRLLAETGPIARGLGQRLAPGRIARAMRPEELHADVSGLLERLREALLAPEVVVTSATALRRR